MKFIFATPIYVILLIIVAYVFWRWRNKERIGEKGILFLPVLSIVMKACGPCKDVKGMVLFFSKLIALVLIILALMQPQEVNTRSVIKGKGVDIIIALDISGSMQALDFGKEDRLAVAKKEAEKFISGRKGDRIGLVVFAAKTFLQCPLTLDYNMLRRFIGRVHIGQIQDGTAIGSAIATSLRHLRKSEAKTKLIILITDGVNNAGNVDPVTAANLAKELGIKVYAIGVGKQGLAPFPVNDPIFGKRIVYQKTEIDEKLLKKISSITGGAYFRAMDEASMRKIFKTIDKLEKSDIKTVTFSRRKELYPWFLWGSLFLIVFIVFGEDIFFMSIP